MIRKKITYLRELCSCISFPSSCSKQWYCCMRLIYASWTWPPYPAKALVRLFPEPDICAGERRELLKDVKGVRPEIPGGEDKPSSKEGAGLSYKPLNVDWGHSCAARKECERGDILGVLPSVVKWAMRKKNEVGIHMYSLYCSCPSHHVEETRLGYLVILRILHRRRHPYNLIRVCRYVFSYISPFCNCLMHAVYIVHVYATDYHVDIAN